MTRVLSRLAVASVLLALGTAAVSAQPTAYVVPVILSQTGQAANTGKGETDALELYETLANRQGGIDGHPIRFEFHDDQSSPAVAVALASTVLTEHPAVALGCSLAQTCAAMMPLFAKGPVLLAFSPVVEPAPGSYAFAPIYRGEDGIAAQLRYYVGERITRIAMLSSTDASGERTEQATLEALKRPEFRGLQVVAIEHVNPTDLTFAAQIARIKAARPQALMVWTSGTPFSTVLRDLASVGLNVPISTTAANMVADQLSSFTNVLPHELLFSGGSFLNGNRAAGDPLRAAVAEFLSACAGGGVPPTIVAAAAWDPGKIAVTALRRLGPSATADQVRAYIEGLHDFAGAGGIYDFRSGDQHGLHQSDVLVVRWDPGRESYSLVSRQGGAPLHDSSRSQ